MRHTSGNRAPGARDIRGSTGGRSGAIVPGDPPAWKGRPARSQIRRSGQPVKRGVTTTASGAGVVQVTVTWFDVSGCSTGSTNDACHTSEPATALEYSMVTLPSVSVTPCTTLPAFGPETAVNV